ncbi:MAG: dihydroneopterin aldolase [Mangrovibacterium sp.]
MSGLIEIEGMEFYAYHGHYPVEKQVGTRFIVSVQLVTDCEKAGRTDRLEDALNYQSVYDLIKQEMASPSDLLEHVCTRILDALYASFPTLEQATIKLSKMNPPMGGQIGKVSVSLTR